MAEEKYRSVRHGMDLPMVYVDRSAFAAWQVS